MPTLTALPRANASASSETEPPVTAAAGFVRQHLAPAVADVEAEAVEVVDEVVARGVGFGIPAVLRVVLRHGPRRRGPRRAGGAARGLAVEMGPGDRLAAVLVVEEEGHRRARPEADRELHRLPQAHDPGDPAAVDEAGDRGTRRPPGRARRRRRSRRYARCGGTRCRCEGPGRRRPLRPGPGGCRLRGCGAASSSRTHLHLQVGLSTGFPFLRGGRGRNLGIGSRRG